MGRGSRPYLFSEAWLHHKNFQDLLSSGWQGDDGEIVDKINKFWVRVQCETNICLAIFSSRRGVVWLELREFKKLWLRDLLTT